MADEAKEGGATGAAAAEAAEGPTAEDVKDWKAEAEKWRAMSRKHEGQAKGNADAAKRLQELEDKDKTELERLTAAQQAADQRAAAAEAKALRFEVALAKQVPPKLMKFLSGSTQDEIEASAAELLEAVQPDTGATDGDAGSSGLPKERLRTGTVTEAEPEVTDPGKLAEQFSRPYAS